MFKKTLLLVTLVLNLSIFISCFHYVSNYVKDKKTIENGIEELLSIIEDNSQSSYQILFKKLSVVNDDMVSWIRINGTKIDYPILQSTDNDFYLSHDFNNNPNSHGSIFMDFRNSSDFTDRNTILYGHNMKDGTMFNQLQYYFSSQDNIPNLYITTFSPYGEKAWEIFAGYEVSIDKDFLIQSFKTSEEFEKYINNIRSLSTIFLDITCDVNTNDRLLTLATCTNRNSNYRYVIHAKEIKTVGRCPTPHKGCALDPLLVACPQAPITELNFLVFGVWGEAPRF